MIKLENVEVYGWEAAIRGMRNPMNSWDKSDSNFEYAYGAMHTFKIGPNDLDLMKRLIKGGPDHSKFMRMIGVSLDIVAPLYWWKEFDTYKVGTVANSCSTMHKIHDKEFTIDDFSHEHLVGPSMSILKTTIDTLNYWRDAYNLYNNKEYWWNMIQLLPTSYNQRRTVTLNYSVLANMYKARKAHKLDEWVDFCKWIETLPYSELITGEWEK